MGVDLEMATGWVRANILIFVFVYAEKTFFIPVPSYIRMTEKFFPTVKISPPFPSLSWWKKFFTLFSSLSIKKNNKIFIKYPNIYIKI